MTTPTPPSESSVKNASHDTRPGSAGPGWARLVAVVQQLSMARDLAKIMEIVRHAARDLTGADGASFVLADGDLCYYADEDAIAPLWKGLRFPMSMCVSGWVIRNRESAVIPDIYADPRVPADAYRPTFVKSLAMVPIRTASPLGAIGNYWAAPTMPSDEQLALLKALADTTSVAMENVRLYSELEQRVKDRTCELEAANRELEAFSYSVSHDLRAPLRAITGFTDMLRTEHAHQLDAEGMALLAKVTGAGVKMRDLIDALLGLARIGRTPLSRERVDLTDMARGILSHLRASSPERDVVCSIDEGMVIQADPRLTLVVLDNILSNAWKYTSKRPDARIEVGASASGASPLTVHVRDNGAGFDSALAENLFAPFQRFHAASEFPGIGIGLATVRRVVDRHGGRVWVEAAKGKGATFSFTLGDSRAPV